ncbi:MAG TPA: MATE family efflux transporter [Gemmatimonadota bacterium]|nr:MATE family efflux transporter [Gemmatimonadota bacterium]
MSQGLEPLAPNPAAASAPSPGLLADVREAVRGSQQDYTEGPIGRALLLLAVPMVLETVMESLFALTDIFWVSRLGPVAVTAVGLTESILILVYTLALGLSIGATAMVSRRIGEKDPDGAARSAVQAIALGFGVAAVLGVLGGIYAPELLALMGASPAVVAEGTGYARIMFAGNGTVLLLFLLNAVFRGAGDAAIAMRVLWLANGINIVLDPLLIFGWGPFPELGVTGAAIATNIGRGTAVLIQIVTLVRRDGRVRVRREHMHLNPGLLWRMVRLSGTGTFQIFVGEASFILLIRILAGFGTDVVAGYTVAIRLLIFALLPAWGLSNAAATMVGQSLGAGKPERAEYSVRLAGLANVAVLGGAGLVFVLFAPAIVAAFTSDPEPARWGVLCLRIVGLGFPFYGYGMVMTQSFNGAGDTWTPTLINIGCFWLFELPAAWLLSQHGLGPAGVFLAITIAYSAVAVVGGSLFRRGRWKEARV